MFPRKSGNCSNDAKFFAVQKFNNNHCSTETPEIMSATYLLLQHMINILYINFFIGRAS